MKIKIKNIPPVLRKRRQWVGHKNKKPVDPNQEIFTLGKTNDSATWGSLKDALVAMKRLGLDGIGFVFTTDDPYIGIDLDHCRNAKTGKVKTWARKIVEKLGSYAEISPSDTGLHIIIKGDLPGGNRKGAGVEIYDQGRFFTFTGDQIEFKKIKTRTKALRWLVAKYFPASVPDSIEPIAREKQDQEIIDRAMAGKNGDKFQRLWDGDHSDYASRSEADMALCSMLAFYTGQDPEAIDRLFRQSCLYRKKWIRKHYADGSTYGDRTIKKAIASLPVDLRPLKPGKSEVQKLLILAESFDLFSTPLGEPFSTIKKDDHYETLPIRSSAFKSHLVYQYYKQEKHSPNPTAVSSTIDTLTALAQHDGPTKDIFTRVAGHGKVIYLFLANIDFEAVKITSKGWKVVKVYPVAFVKKPGMLPLPKPSTKGNIRAILDFINVKDFGSKILLLSWLVGAAFPDGPYPILVLQGVQGSAKSTASKLVRFVLDPSVAPIRALPRSERDLAISAGNSHVLAFDNISRIQPWMGDCLCRLATGGGFATRKLYSDTEEIILELTRPVILNGIAFLPHAHDLIDRAILIELAPIPSGKRRDEAEMLADFQDALPGILGGLCTALSEALKNLPGVEVQGLPRMADFAKRIIAAEPAMPWKAGAFMKHYDRNIASAVLKSLEGDTVATGVMALMRDYRKWTGTASQLLAEFKGSEDEEGYVPIEIQKNRDWPRTPGALSKRLKRASTFLDKIGIKVAFPRTAKKRKIIIKKVKK